MAWDILKKIGGLAFFLLLVSACGSIGGSGQCGGAAETGSCLSIDKIEPKDKDKTTINVDAFSHICSDGKIEGIFDHNAKVTFSNTPLPGVQVNEITDITLGGYSIAYSINQCPSGNGCPALPTVTSSLAVTLRVPANGSVTTDFPFVSLATKDIYRALGGTPFDVPSYTATYTVRGTDRFKNPVKVQGSQDFTIADFETCATTDTATTTPTN